MSPATGGIKLQRSHTSQGEREAGRSRKRISEGEKVSCDDERVQVSDKMRAKRSKQQKGKASRPAGGEGVYYTLKVQHIKHAERT